jgi:adenosine deaminase
MKFKSAIFIVIIFTIVGCSHLKPSSGLSNAKKTELLYNEFIEGDSPNIAQLNLFFSKMPKGGDIHHHYSGSIYAETYLDWADDNDKKINKNTLKGEDSGDGNISVKNLRKNTVLYRKLLTLWSDKDYKNHYHLQTPPDAHFFNTFGYFRSVAKTDEAELKKGLEVLKERAIKENVSYIETMLESIKYPENETDIESKIKPFDKKLRETTSYNGIEVLLDELSSEIDHELSLFSSISSVYQNPIDEFIEKIEEAHIGIDDDQFMMRYQTFASRNSSPSKVFLDLYSAFKAVEKSELLVGVNIVGPENGVVAIEDYTLHMQMFAYLKNKFPEVNKALHAGELTLGMVRPKNLKFHISQAIDVAGAQRIGHGVDLPYEEDAIDLLERIKANSVVEINLTSNEFILGVEGWEHPYLIYSASGVPIVISTDDSGVSRNNLTGEYVLLAARYKPSYKTVKEYVYNSIKYSFLSEDDKDILINSLDVRFRRFEAEMGKYSGLMLK